MTNATELRRFKNRTISTILWFILLNIAISSSFQTINRQNYQLHYPSRTNIGGGISSIIRQAKPKPIDPSAWPDRFPAKEHCSKCGLCETKFVLDVTTSCAFLNEGMSRIDDFEPAFHGRNRNVNNMMWSNTHDSDQEKESFGIPDEGRFGVLHEPIMLAKGVNIENAQWTGCVTAIAISMLESGMVDAVVCVANDTSGGWSVPEPIIAKTVNDVMKGRGVKPSLAPSLRILDEIEQDPSIRKLLFCGVGCSVQAFRAVQHKLNLDEVYVLGTNCVDNSPTPEAAQNFIKNGVKVQGDVRGYEFMQDFRVHVKLQDGYYKKPYFSLPGSIAEPSIATSCLACFDYTNALADVVIGYMGAPLENGKRMDESFQTLTIRNQRGSKMVQTALQSSRLEIGPPAMGSGNHEQMALATVASDAIVMKMTGGKVKEEGLPLLVGEFMAFALRSIGPKGINFARYSIDYHILRNYLHVVDSWGVEKAKSFMPRYARDIVDFYINSDDTINSLLSKLSKSTE